MTLPKLVLTSQPAAEGAASPREQLSNQVARISQLQRKTAQVRTVVACCVTVQLSDHVTSLVMDWILSLALYSLALHLSIRCKRLAKYMIIYYL